MNLLDNIKIVNENLLYNIRGANCPVLQPPLDDNEIVKSQKILSLAEAKKRFGDYRNYIKNKSKVEKTKSIFVDNDTGKEYDWWEQIGFRLTLMNSNTGEKAEISIDEEENNYSIREELI